MKVSPRFKTNFISLDRWGMLIVAEELSDNVYLEGMVGRFWVEGGALNILSTCTMGEEVIRA